jgi:tetratricopeptide (TPR) repeat protein
VTPADLDETDDAQGTLGEAPRHRRGASIGRYIVLDELGEGGMGVVLAAYDPQLDRRVALKLLRAAPGGLDAVLRERVLFEARALARVVHPNIVAVHDAGFHDDELFLVLELVDGTTLRGWLSERRRASAEILEAFVQAARGLAAAHAAGVVHRDFKPDNVLRGRDGRVRVADFGLARVADAVARAADAAHAVPPSLHATRTGTLVGTPAYMAPEQHAGERVDARADQWAFCASLFEALHGVRPFGGDSLDELSSSVRSGKVSPGSRDVPAWVQAVLLRGLAVDPAARFPSMDALIEALLDDPARRRGRALLGLGGVVLLAAGGVAGWAWTRGAAPGALCRAAGGEVAAVWNHAARERVAAAFERTGVAYAGAVRERAAVRLDAYAAGWAEMRVEACEATRVRGVQSEAALDLRMRCLDGRLRELAATASVLASVSAAEVDGAAGVAADLAPLAACADLEALSAAVPPPADPAVRARVAAVEGRLAEVAALRRAGRYLTGFGIAAPAVEEARLLGHRPALARALREKGGLQHYLGNVAAAEETVREALATAAAGRDDGLFAEIAVQLTAIVGTAQVRLEEARAMRAFVDAALDRAAAGPQLRAVWLTVQGSLDARERRHASARERYQQALALRESALGPDHPEVAVGLRQLGTALRNEGRLDEARQVLERALAAGERALGPDHPEQSATLNSLGVLLKEQGDLAGARDVYARALALRERTLGRDHREVAVPLVNLGNVLVKLGEHDRARAALERALAIRERTAGRDHPDVARVLSGLGALHRARRAWPDAVAAYTRALDLYRKAYAADHAAISDAHGRLGNLYRDMGELGPALEHLELDLALTEKREGPDARDVAIALANTATVLTDLGRHAEARRRLARALAILDRSPPGTQPVDPAHPLAALADLELRQGRGAAAVPLLERSLALRLAAHAEEHFIAETRALLARARARR